MSEQPKKKRARRKGRGEHYVDNKEFTLAIVEYTRGVKEDKEKGVEPRMMPDYVALSLMKIAEGLSHSPNFINYTYREDMVMDAVENCIKAIMNYDPEKPTRTGKPNPFSYFTQISYFAFLRRIAKEKKQVEIKQSIINRNDAGEHANFGTDETQMGNSMIEGMRYINEEFYDESLSTADPDDKVIKPPADKKRSAKKRIPSPLLDFLSE